MKEPGCVPWLSPLTSLRLVSLPINQTDSSWLEELLQESSESSDSRSPAWCPVPGLAACQLCHEGRQRLRPTPGQPPPRPGAPWAGCEPGVADSSIGPCWEPQLDPTQMFFAGGTQVARGQADFREEGKHGAVLGSKQPGRGGSWAFTAWPGGGQGWRLLGWATLLSL